MNEVRKNCKTGLCGNTTLTKYCYDCRIKNTEVIIILGASGSGKSTLVKNNLKPGDLILDFDEIFKALSGQPIFEKPENLLPFVLATRNKILSLIGEVENTKRCFIIRNKYKDNEIFELKKRFNAYVILLKPEKNICKERLKKDKTRPRGELNKWFERVDEWYNEHENNPEFIDNLKT